MICPSCGTTLSDNAKFCGACGAKVVVTEPNVQSSTQPASVPAIGSAAAVNPASMPEPTSTVALQSVITVQVDAHQKGVLSQSWADITASEGWIKRVLLLMVMNIVPVLNLFVSGYILQWGADASRGVNPTLPKHNFNLRCLLTGLFYFIMSLLLTICSMWTGILAIIPIIGWIAAVVIGFFANAFLAMAGMRMAIFGRLGAAFELSDLFSKYKRRLGSLFAAVVVPNLIVIVVVAALVCLLLIGGCSVSSGILGMGSRGMSGAPLLNGDLIGMALAGAGIGLFFLIVIIILAVFFAGFAQLWTMRAVGIWAARVAPEWYEEAACEQTAAKESDWMSACDAGE